MCHNSIEKYKKLKKKKISNNSNCYSGIASFGQAVPPPIPPPPPPGLPLMVGVLFLLLSGSEFKVVKKIISKKFKHKFKAFLIADIKKAFLVL